MTWLVALEKEEEKEEEKRTTETGKKAKERKGNKNKSKEEKTRDGKRKREIETKKEGMMAFTMLNEGRKLCNLHPAIGGRELAQIFDCAITNERCGRARQPTAAGNAR